MEEHIIYIAGNPNAYPIEYYDRDTQSYQGVVPELMRRFSEQSQYDVRYYRPGKADQRKALAEEQQVDIISCPEDVDAISHRVGEDIVFLDTDGMPTAYRLCVLDVAPSGLAGDLRSFLSGYGQREMTELVIQSAQLNPPHSRKLAQNIFFGMALAVLVLTIAIVCVIIRGRKKLGELRRGKEIDPVTGLGNREHLERYFQAYLNDRNRVLYSVFCFCYGSETLIDGMESATLLRHIAVILQDSASDTDILARVSDNGFAMLRLSSEGKASEEWLTSVLNRIWEGAGLPGCSRARDVTAGVYQLRSDDRNLDEILFRGICGAQSARQMGIGYQFFSGETQQKIKEEQRLRADGARSLQNREFQLYLQFYADAQTGRAMGAEASLFWEHPDRGLLLPERYRTILEQEGLAEQLDNYLLDQACTLLDNLRRGGREDFFLVCRVSAKTVASGGLTEQWREIIGSLQFDRRMLLLSVPRDAAFGDGELSDRNLKAIREMGMQLVLEDFDGQAEDLALAREAQFSGLKLNGALVDRLAAPGGQVVLASILQAGHQLKLAFFAEDVGTEERSDCLRKLGCDLLRGALYSRPLPVWEAAKKLTGRRVRKEML